MIPSSEVLVLAGFGVSVIAAAAAALVVHSEKTRSALLVGIVVIVAAASVLYVRAQRTADSVLQERIAREVSERLSNEQAFQQTVDEVVERRLQAERTRKAEADSLARERVSLQLAEEKEREMAEYADNVRRDAIRAAEKARQVEAARRAEEQRRILQSHRNRLIGTWEYEDWAGCRNYMRFTADGGFRNWMAGPALCRLGSTRNYSRYEVVNLDGVRVSGPSGTALFRLGFNVDGELVFCGIDLGSATRWMCLDSHFRKVTG